MNNREFQPVLTSNDVLELTSSLTNDTTEHQYNLIGESLYTEPQGMPMGEGLLPGSVAFSQTEAVIESAATRLKSNLINFTTEPTLESTLTTAFGEQVDTEQAKELLKGFAVGENGPEVRVVDGDLLTGQGAFGNDTIFISDDLVLDNADHPEVLDRVLLEETGHYLDQALHDGDSPGDEGAIFAGLVQGNPLSGEELLRIRQEDDQSILWLDQHRISVELNDGYSAHTIEAGDTLWAIATEQLGDGNRWPEILKDNQDLNSTFSETEAAQIQAGQVVYIPDDTEPAGAVEPDPNTAEEQPEDATTQDNIEPAEEIAAPVDGEDTTEVTNTSDTSGATEPPNYPGNTFKYEEDQPLEYDANVEQWQQRMADLGWTIGVDGKYGAESSGVAEEFQKLYDDLTDDGIVGEKTWAKTFSADAVGPSPEEESDPTGEVLEEPSSNYIELVSLPDKASMNLGINTPSQSFMLSALGNPNIGSKFYEYSNLIDTRNVGPFTVTGLKPMLDDLEDIFAQVKVENAQLFEDVQEIGMLVRRAKKNSSGNEISGTISNHSWGTAIDLYFGEGFDFAEDGRTNRGLVELAPYFYERGYIWGAGFSNFEDSGHFEASSQLIQQWQENDWNQISFNSESGSKNSDSSSSDGIEFLPDVQKYQAKLLELGYGLPKFGADGKLGDETADAVRDFQLEHGLEVTQQFDDATVEALGWEHVSEKIGQANILGNVSSGISVLGNIGDPNEYDPSVSSSPSKDESDSYQFSIQNVQNIKIYLGGLAKNVSLELLDSEGNFIAGNDETSNSLIETLAADTYTVKVSNVEGETDYRLSISNLDDSNSDRNIEPPDPNADIFEAPESLNDQQLVDQLDELDQRINNWSGAGRSENDPGLDSLVSDLHTTSDEIHKRSPDLKYSKHLVQYLVDLNQDIENWSGDDDAMLDVLIRERNQTKDRLESLLGESLDPEENETISTKDEELSKSFLDLLTTAPHELILEYGDDVLRYVWDTIQGDWNEEQDFPQIIANMGAGLIPVADQILDVRDFAANLYFLVDRDEYDSPERWINLALTGIGAVPTVGSVIKGLGKLSIRYGPDAASYGDDILKAIQEVKPSWGDIDNLGKVIDSNWDAGVEATRDFFNLVLDGIDNLIPFSWIPKVGKLKEAVGGLRESLDTKLNNAFTTLKEDYIDDILERLGRKKPHACSSFVAGTEILTPDGGMNIEDIQVGDWVIADDPTTPGEIESRQVLNTFSRQVDTIIDLNVDGEIISTTTEHPFWVKGDGWVEAENLEKGMLLQTDEETHVKIDQVSQRDGEFDVYNFEVDDFHTYFVSDLEILVHNAQSFCVPDSISQNELGTRIDVRNEGGNKEVFAYGDDKVVGILRPGKDPILLDQELENLKQLDELDIPIVSAGLSNVDGKPAIVYERFALNSKEIVVIDGKKAIKVGDSDLLNTQSIKDLQKIQRTLEDKKIWIEDLQFLIGKDGRVVVADPAFVNHPIKPSNKNINMIRALIEVAQGNKS